MTILMAFLVGGALCLVGQLIMDLTPYDITPGHVLVGYVTLGAVASAIGLYQPLVNLGGAGATIPLSGFGHTLAQGVMDSVKVNGLLGAFGGGVEATSVGIAAAVVFGYMMAVMFNPQG
ncbi:stage V sporulation protein AE [Metallumcola ferriviriculae]|uniref:Stage V sporulation protein AE n=1 Tax=Metallumcola ferriviriculae TaxID=3039180 RepID=A0AAU0UUS3_9FIRM|nr:stage V sporulation protein AE [Desulfitibacteraceae bacterium MK1]